MSKLSQAIADGEGISFIVEVNDAASAKAAESQGADGLAAIEGVNAVRMSSQLPLLHLGRMFDATGAAAEAVVIRPDLAMWDEAHALGLECVVRISEAEDLERALRGMTRTAQERFQEAFDEINRHFGEIFGRLFEGGRAELRMVEPEEGDDADPLEQGVELMAQPRGKRLQAVTLMSGGEKALTGLALLFAIFYFRPSPFCVLDEVDAPLDDANIHRFLRVLRELCTQTQFIVITHNRKTMEAADVLYGVTMEEPGLSRLVSVQLTEA